MRREFPKQKRDRLATTKSVESLKDTTGIQRQRTQTLPGKLQKHRNNPPLHEIIHGKYEPASYQRSRYAGTARTHLGRLPIAPQHNRVGPYPANDHLAQPENQAYTRTSFHRPEKGV
jgi:hypothetical protein